MEFEKKAFFYWLDDGVVEIAVEMETGNAGTWRTIDNDLSAKGDKTARLTTDLVELPELEQFFQPINTTKLHKAVSNLASTPSKYRSMPIQKRCIRSVSVSKLQIPTIRLFKPL